MGAVDANDEAAKRKVLDKQQELEQFVDEAQKKFDEQYELCREVLEERDRQNAAMVCHLEDLCHVQVEYFKEAYDLAVEMEKKVLGRPTKGKDMRTRKDSSDEE